VAELASLVRSHAVVLLYADSGAGKSSLIEAGLRARMEGRLGAVVLTGRVKGPESGPAGAGNVYVENLLRSLGVGPESSESEGTLAQRLGSATWGDGPLRVVVIDQLEEVFTLYPERWSDRRAFFEQIQAAVDGDPRLRFLLAIRSDYLTRLHPYTSAFTDDLRTRYGLERLRRKDAVDAVTLPSTGTSRTFSIAAAELLVEELLAIPSEVTGAPAVPGEFVEPGELQIVCRDIWQRVPPGEIEPDQIRTLTRLDEVHGRFYDRAVAETVGANRVSEVKLRRWFEESLITPAGTRSFLFKGKTHTAGLPNPVVDVLERQQIVRVERRANSQWYELTHDRMVPAVVESNRRWFSRRSKRLRRRVAITAAAVALVLLAAAIVTVFDERSVVPTSATLASIDYLNESGFHRARDVEEIRFTALEDTEAILTLDVNKFVPSQPWSLTLLDPDGVEVDATELTEDQTEIRAILRQRGTYTLEITGGSDSYYTVRGQTAAASRPTPLERGVSAQSIVDRDRPNLHPITDTQPGLLIVTIRSEGAHYATVLDADENFVGGPDYEEPLLSRTVLRFPGEYVLEISMDDPGTYSVTVETPTVEPLVEGQTREATIGIAGELDVYSFESPSGRVALFRMSSGSPPDLRVLTPDGFGAEVMPLESNAEGQSGFVAFPVQESGTHFLVAAMGSANPFDEFEPPFDEFEPATGSYRLSYVTTELPR